MIVEAKYNFEKDEAVIVIQDKWGYTVRHERDGVTYSELECDTLQEAMSEFRAITKDWE